MRLRNVALAGALALTLGNAQAELFDRGGGLIYDDALNITWLQDANYATTSGYDADGKMNWYSANTWAANLVYGGFDDWRLPTVSAINGVAFNLGYKLNGSTDYGFNISEQGTAYAGSTNNEMAYLYFNTLDNKSECDPVASNIACVNQAGWGLTNSSFFTNLQSDNYWSGTETAPGSGRAWHFGFHRGLQEQNPADSNYMFALAVRNGDVAAPIPEPETYAMMLAGLGLLGLARRRKQKLNA